MSTFSKRLQATLTYDGYITSSAKIKRLAETFSVHSSTARRWLAGDSKPRKICTQNFLNGYRTLNMPFDWLFRGEWEWTYATTERQAIIAGKSPQVVKVITAMRTMTEWEQSKVLRMLIRMGNNDPKVSRLSDMRDLGQISVQQFLAMM